MGELTLSWGVVQLAITLGGLASMGGVLWAKVDRIEKQQDWMMAQLFTPKGGDDGERA